MVAGDNPIIEKTTNAVPVADLKQALKNTRHWLDDLVSPFARKRPTQQSSTQLP